MQNRIPLLLLFFLLNSACYSQIKKIYLTDDDGFNPNNNPNGPFHYCRWERWTNLSLHGKYPDGNYHVYNTYDSSIVGYIEIRKNKLNGIYMLFEHDKNIDEIGLIKKNKKIGIWLHFLDGYLYDVKRHDKRVDYMWQMVELCSMIEKEI